MEYQHRRMHVLHVCDRGVLEVGIGCTFFERERAEVPLEYPSEVTRSVHREPVVDSAFGARGFEPIRVSRDPTGHKAPVRATDDAESIWIAIVESLESGVHDGQQVFLVHGSPSGPIR